MRFAPWLGLALGIAALFDTSAAFATGGVGGKGDTGGKGGNGPTSSTETSNAPASDTSSSTDVGQPLGPVYHDATEHRPQEKPWEVVVDFEVHRLLESQYLTEGLGAVQTFNVLDLAGYYLVTPDDRLRLEGAAFQYFLADSGEPGVRLDDVELEYAHTVHLPWQLIFRAAAGVTIPLSYGSQLASNITSPFAKLRLARRFGYLSVAFGLSARDYIDRYSSAAALGGAPGDDTGSGQPNVNWAFGGTLSAEYSFPFFRPLSVGASVADLYLLYYGVGSCPYDSMCYGATSDPQFGTSQPVQQSYSESVYLRYALPDLSNFHSNVVLALANGDPAVGYPSVLNDGIQHPYFFYYDTTEVYLALEGAY